MPHAHHGTFSALGFSQCCSRQLWTASVRSTAEASDPMVTRRHTSAAAIDGWIESPVQHCVLSKSLAKFVVLQFCSNEIGSRQACTDRCPEQLSNRQHWTRDRLRVVAEFHSSLVFRVLREKPQRRCLRKNLAMLWSFGSIAKRSRQSTELEHHHQQMLSPANPHLLLHLLYAGNGAGTSPPATPRSVTAALVRLPPI